MRCTAEKLYQSKLSVWDIAACIVSLPYSSASLSIWSACSLRFPCRLRARPFRYLGATGPNDSNFVWSASFLLRSSYGLSSKWPSSMTIWPLSKHRSWTAILLFPAYTSNRSGYTLTVTFFLAYGRGTEVFVCFKWKHTVLCHTSSYLAEYCTTIWRNGKQSLFFFSQAVCRYFPCYFIAPPKAFVVQRLEICNGTRVEKVPVNIFYAVFNFTLGFRVKSFLFCKKPSGGLICNTCLTRPGGGLL